MTYVDDIESDLSVYHRIYLWDESFHRVMRLAGRLPSYGGALAQAMGAAQTEQPVAATAPVLTPEVSTPYPQAVDTSGDTPPEVVARMWEQAILKQYPGATGIRRISADELERQL